MGQKDEESLPRDATKEEIRDLFHEVDKIPISAWLLTFTGAAAQLARFSITVAWQNYLQNPPGNPLLPGALNLGQSKATTIQNGFLFFQYLTPLPFAVISDAWIGRYKTMVVSLSLLVIGYIVLFLTSLPRALEHGAGIGGLVTTMFLVGLGQGGLSAVMYPFIGDQIPEENPKVKRNQKGELVVIDRKLAIQYVFNGYYWMSNIAALFIIPATLVEKHIGFWACYLLPTCVLIVAVIPVLIWNRRLIKLPPQGNVLPQTSKVLAIAIRSHFHLSAASPSHQLTCHNRVVPWSPTFVSEIRRGLKGCRVIICFVIFWLCYNQLSNNIISQAGQMKQQGLSNDTMGSLNAVACVIMGPIIQNLLIPFLRRHRVPFGPIMRMTVAFLFIAAGIAYIAGLQSLIYSRRPCFEHPLECPAAADGSRMRPNDISVWLQTPMHFLLAVGEILGLVSLSEYTYNEAPPNLKAMVQAFQALAAALGAALGMALGPALRNPWLVIMYASLAGSMAVSALVFWGFFRRHDTEYEKEDNEKHGSSGGPSTGVESGSEVPIDEKNVEGRKVVSVS
ncbi:POT family-domain-containing protein [Amylocarpus encephaloides]|uniref:POT family-domain-containing protein n=1 Tax=Amylocarpus encephaloides TaxID=45428 RepID=A0A9P7YMD7_9HELO|nr:POT family-domain-containing protein [Amylocarpus encephaloides]